MNFDELLSRRHLVDLKCLGGVPALAQDLNGLSRNDFKPIWVDLRRLEPLIPRKRILIKPGFFLCLLELNTSHLVSVSFVVAYFSKRRQFDQRRLVVVVGPRT